MLFSLLVKWMKRDGEDTICGKVKFFLQTVPGVNWVFWVAI